MSDKSAIEWTDASWNPLRGTAGRHTCARISPGCDNCYAATMNRRGLGGTAPLDFGRGESLNDPPRLDEKALMQPHRWRAPRRVFVCSMTDIAGAWVPFEWFHAMWTVMAETPRHTYQVLTKRPSRLRALIGEFQQDAPGFGPYPLPNVWVGTTIESDAYTWRANVLRQTPAAVRWISAEPLLSRLPSLDFTGIDWLVAGGESGHHARPMHPDWPRDLRDRCTESGTAYFFKQWGEFEPDWQEPHPDNPWTDDETDRSRDQLIDMTGRDCMNWTAPDQVQPFALLRRVGRKAAGRLLDGREWNEFPDALPASKPPEPSEVTSR
jgi:protein gp37